MHSWLSCTCDCHALVTVMHLLLKTEDFVQNRLLILHFWLRKKVYFEEKPSTFGGSFCCISAQFLTFSIAYSAQHCCKNTSKTLPYQSCKFGGLWTIFKIFDPKGWSCEESVVAAFFFDPSVPNKVQEHFKITSQLVFMMVPTSPASFVQIGALWFFFVPRVPPLHHFSFLVAHTPTRCKQTSKSLPSLFFWWSPPVLQVSSRLEHFEFFFFQGSPLWIFSGFW